MEAKDKANQGQNQAPAEQKNGVTAPAITLPKGGGAIRGIGEKFAANPVTGTGSMTVPIATSPGRSGFGPQLSLSYDSGTGNGPFGFGWSLSLPSITRKTDKGLPKYQDADESDVCILSGAEDLVPVLIDKGDGKWEREQIPPRTINGKTYRIHRYRPRIEGLFARIERWTDVATGEIHWRSITRDNITTLYGKDNNSRIFDPADPDPAHPTRIFSWLICQSYDDKGNAIIYEYQSQDSQRIFEDQQRQSVAWAHERNRNDATRSANRYLKRIKYGNRTPNRDATTWQATDPAQLPNETWMFEVVFDYGEGHYTENAPDAQGRIFTRAQIEPPAGSHWPVRQDPFSTYRAGFEVRTYRLCRRVLMFHHFPQELGINDCLVRSTEFSYAESPIASFISSITQSAYVRQPIQDQPDRYLKQSLPPLEFKYSQVPSPEELAQQPIREVDTESLANLPVGLDGGNYQWMDLDSEGTSGILTEQADGWYYKRNLSANNLVLQDGHQYTVARFGATEVVARKPAIGLGGGGQFLDLAGDGQVDLVQMEGAVRGFYERTDDASWLPFQPFASWPDLNTRDPDVKFVDLTGDGHADILITEGEALTWYPSLAEEGFGPAVRVSLPLDEEKGPRLVFADSEQSIYLADLSGDGLSDLVRIRNREVCYWPNLGYGRFGARVTMDHAPWFDAPDQFDQRRIRLADTDGSGTTDMLYLRRDGVQIYFNQSGNRWSDAVTLPQFPPSDHISSVLVLDLLGNGTPCLVWSSPLPGAARRPMRYLALMEAKPHLLVGVKNNLGAETKVHYAPSTRFYLDDKRDGKPWITRLPFPVHVVERVETYDRISRNHFVTRYTYHHGYFDGEEREFRGFGRVEQWDTEAFAALAEGGTLPEITNLDAASHVPPVLTRTWFHTGVYVGRDHVSDFFAGDKGEYYREPGLTDAEARALLLPDTVLPPGLTPEEEREACRALKGSMLRQEVYTLDGTGSPAYPYGHPYTVTEQNFTIRMLQRQGTNRYAVFFTHAREAITYHYERRLVPVLNGQIVDDATAAAHPDVRWRPDPRVQHTLTLEVDSFGNVMNSATIGYGRRFDAPDAGLLPEDRVHQRLIHITYTKNTFTRPFRVGMHAAEEAASEAVDEADAFRVPLPAASHTYELRQPQQERTPAGQTMLFRFDDIMAHAMQAGDGEHEINYEDLDFTRAKQAAANDPVQNGKYFRRLIEQVRTLYRPDDWGAAQNDPLTLLPLGTVQPLALPGESYKLAFTPGLLVQIYQRPRNGQLPEHLLPAPADVLGGQGADRGGYMVSQGLKATGVFPNTDPDDHWWLPAARVFYSPNTSDNAAQERAYAGQHFFLPQRYRDPFGQTTTVRYDVYDLLMAETRDPLGNRVTVGERDATGNVTSAGNDYRVLQPRLVTDPNRNRTEVAFDTLGMVAGTAVKGKDNTVGDTLTGLEAELTSARINAFYDADDPHTFAVDLLKDATTRIIYDLNRFKTTGQPVFAATLARETHVSDPLPPQGLKIQLSFSYSDGSGREIQKKIQAEPETSGGPLRWVGSGWTIFNNKGKPVRQYEPFFSQRAGKRHQFEFGVQAGVSPILFYDPVERVVATLHPNHTYEKVVFDPWQQATYDVNDTVAASGAQTGDPRTDRDIAGYVHEYFKTQLAAWETWHTQRRSGALGAQEQAAANKATAHADTPTTAYFDTLGRTFLTIADNGKDANGLEQQYPTRIMLDIEGNQREVRDAMKQNGDQQGRIVMRYDYDMMGNRIHQASMEAGERWMLNDVTGKPIRAWDSRGHTFRTAYDPLRRPLRIYVTGADSANPSQELLTERLVYGEQHPEEELRNLRGQLYLHLDQAGVVCNEFNDFKGNLQRASRRLTNGTQYKQTVDWRAVDANHVALPPDATTKLDLVALEATFVPRLAADAYTSLTTYDALNRPVTLTTPHTPAMQPNVIRSGYNEANLLERVEANLHGASDTNGQPVWTSFITDIDYNAKGQRTRIDYATKDGKLISTSYRYDRDTFRLLHLYTRRGIDPETRQGVTFTDDCDNPQPPPTTIAAPESPPEGKSCGVQNLHYTHDPVGNITHIRDDAQQTIYFRNQRVEPSADYIYDAIYRLIHATGREHLGQAGGGPVPTSPSDAPRIGRDHPNNDQALGRYEEEYVYDEVGNILSLRHRGTDPMHPGWKHCYQYALDSNRLLSTGSPSDPNNPDSACPVHYAASPVYAEKYGYDAHGSMTSMPHLAQMVWDFKDQLQSVDLGGGGTAYYVYDAGGQRVWKVVEKNNGNLIEERIYLGGFEIFRQRNGNSVKLERETLHIMDDKQRIALVETKTVTNPNDDSAEQLIRYQFGNHLGSASLELDDNAMVISYEEYYPYGSTSYQAVNQGVRAAAKRYRYTGKERDEETGLNYHGARYYAPWLGRWVSADPRGMVDGTNLFAYTRNNPLKYADPTGTQCDPTIATCPELMGNWSYGTPVPDRASVGHNVQRDHPIQVNLRSEQRGGQYTRRVSAARSEQTVLVETGRGRFHTEVGRLQAEINARVRAGIIRTEAGLIEATREAYRLAGEATRTAVNAQALDRAIVSNLATLSETAEQTVAELRQSSGPTTVTGESINQAFRDPSPPRTTATRPPSAEPPSAAPNAGRVAAPQSAAPTVAPEPPPASQVASSAPSEPLPSEPFPPGTRVSRLLKVGGGAAKSVAGAAKSVAGKVLEVAPVITAGSHEELNRNVSDVVITYAIYLVAGVPGLVAYFFKQFEGSAY